MPMIWICIVLLLIGAVTGSVITSIVYIDRYRLDKQKDHRKWWEEDDQ